MPTKKTNMSLPITYKTLTCTSCGRVYAYHHSDSKGHTKKKCNSCLVNLRRFEYKKKCLAYKGGKCEHCGYEKCSRALSFHHTDPTKKDFELGGSHARSWISVSKELDKCQLLCANCHFEVHEREDELRRQAQKSITANSNNE